MLNRCDFIGRVGRDVECRYTQSGDAVANVSIACSEQWKDKQGQKQERTEWIKVTFFGKLAEIVNQYVTKGSLIYVSGKMITRKWQDRDGNDRYTTEIRASEMKMLGGKSDQGGQNTGGGGFPSRGGDPFAGAPSPADDMSDIPF